MLITSAYNRYNCRSGIIEVSCSLSGYCCSLIIQDSHLESNTRHKSETLHYLYMIIYTIYLLVLLRNGDEQAFDTKPIFTATYVNKEPVKKITFPLFDDAT